VQQLGQRRQNHRFAGGTEFWDPHALGSGAVPFAAFLSTAGAAVATVPVDPAADVAVIQWRIAWPPLRWRWPLQPFARMVFERQNKTRRTASGSKGWYLFGGEHISDGVQGLTVIGHA
jgi:hypothetical protein